MRELKFRSWNGSKMIGPFGLHEISDGYFEGQWVDLETVEQFTGLKDKNGVEIYEGDLLKYGRFGDYADTISFDELDSGYGHPIGFGYDINPTFLAEGGYIVVGNIHQKHP